MDSSSNRIDDIDDVRAWIAEHDGRINAWWASQHEWNKQMNLHYARIEGRLSAVERKIIYASGFAAAAGSLLGAFLSGIMKTVV